MEQQEATHDIAWNQLDIRRMAWNSGGAILAVRVLIYPPSLIKTRMQTNRAVYTSTRQTFGCIAKTEGFAGFYKGFTPTILGVLPAQLAYITVYESVRFYLPFASDLIGGACASVASLSIGLPLNVISQRMMLQDGRSAKQFHYKGGLDGFRQVFAKEGVSGLYRGFLPALCTHVPNSAVWWATYQPVKNKLVEAYLESSGSTAVPSLLTGFSGMVAALNAAIVTTPLDCVKTKLQTHKAEAGEAVPNAMYFAKQTYQEGGARAFYRGFIPRLVSMVPSSFLLITAYEWCKKNSVDSRAQGS